MMPILLRRGLPLACAAWLLGAAPFLAHAQVKQPSPPKEFDVQIRYRIRQPMPQWLDRFDELQASLKNFGFVRDVRPEDEPEDPEVDRVTGRIPSENARKILLIPFVQTVLAVPQGYKLPPEGQRVKVSLELATGFPSDRQHVLFEQVLNQLDQIGFREMVGYDHRGFTRVLGTIPAENVERLLRDLRNEPNGWLTPRTPAGTLPSPIRNVVPIKFIEVLPEPADVPPAQELPAAPAFPPDQAHLVKVMPSLRAALAKEKDEQKKIRVEVILDAEPKDADASWDRMLRVSAPGSVVEGLFGTIVTVLAPASKVPDLARPASVLAVRLLRVADSSLRPLTEAPADFLREMRLNALHQLGRQGDGIKIAIVAGDFGGYKKLLGNRLPAGTKLVDYTTQRNSDLLPDPMPSDDGQFGPGVLCALAAHAAAPLAELVLVRIDPAAPHQLLAVARLLNDDPAALPDNLADRHDEITRDTESLLNRRKELIEERRKALQDLTFEEGESRLPELRKRYEESQARLKKVLKDLDDLKKEDDALRQRTDRMFAVRAELVALQNTRVVICPLVWNSGYPLEGASVLSRYLDERPFLGSAGDASKARILSLRKNRGTMWVQAAGDSREQTWAGLFRDSDTNLTMEFAPAYEPIHKDRWTSELNFLSWQPYTGAASPEVPEKTRVRITVQWREPHAADLSNEFDDPFREPLASLNLVVLHQRDPQGAKIASDDLEVIARSTGAPVRLYKTSNSGVYEQTVEFENVAAGRLALRVEGRAPESNRPGAAAAVTGQRRLVELRPRIYVESLDPASRARGRVIFQDYAGAKTWPDVTSIDYTFGGVGMPADARNALTVGGANSQGLPSPFSAVGAGPLREMLLKPDVLGFESADFGERLKGSGSGVAAAINGGAVACLLEMNAPAQPRHFLQLLQLPPGAVLRVPATWLETKSTQK